jgi:hypothetical protein
LVKNLAEFGVVSEPAGFAATEPQISSPPRSRSGVGLDVDCQFGYLYNQCSYTMGFRTMNPADSNYTIGRGKPPLHTRFQKGQSGNPSGKPGPDYARWLKGSRSARTGGPIRMNDRVNDRDGQFSLVQGKKQGRIKNGAVGSVQESRAFRFGCKRPAVTERSRSAIMIAGLDFK